MVHTAHTIFANISRCPFISVHSIADFIWIRVKEKRLSSLIYLLNRKFPTMLSGPNWLHGISIFTQDSFWHTHSCEVCHSYSCDSLITFSIMWMNVWLHFSTRMNIMPFSLLYSFCFPNYSFMLLFSCCCCCCWFCLIVNGPCLSSVCERGARVCSLVCFEQLQWVDRNLLSTSLRLVYKMHAAKQWIDVTNVLMMMHTPQQQQQHTFTYEFKWLVYEYFVCINTQGRMLLNHSAF